MAGTTVALLQAMVVPALPAIQEELGTTQTGAAWVLTANLLSTAILTPILGRVGDMLGKERVLVAVLVVLGAGTLVCALAASLPLLLLGRVVQGAGGGVIPLAFGIIRDEFPAERIAGAIGLVASLLGIGAGLGLILAGPILDVLSYHWLFWLPLAILIVTTVVTIRYVPESPITTPGRINWTGAALMSAGLSAVLIAVSQTPTWGWLSARTLLLLAAGLAVIGLWIVAEIRAREPLVDMAMMSIRGVWTTNLAAFLLGMSMFSAFALIPQFVSMAPSAGYGFGASVLGAGLFLLPTATVQLIVGPATGRVERRLGSRVQLQAGMASVVVAFVILLAWHDQPVAVYVAAGVLGLGLGLGLGALANLIVVSVRQEQTGVATGMNTVMRTLGGAFGAQVAATFVSQTIGPGGLPDERGFATAFAVSAAIAAAGLASTIAIPRARDGDYVAPLVGPLVVAGEPEPDDVTLSS